MCLYDMKTIEYVKLQHEQDYTAKLVACAADLAECRYRKHNLQKKLSKLRKHKEAGTWNDDRDHRYMVIECHIEAINKYMKGIFHV